MWVTLTPVDSVSIGLIKVPLQRFSRYTWDPVAPGIVTRVLNCEYEQFWANFYAEENSAYFFLFLKERAEFFPLGARSLENSEFNI